MSKVKELRAKAQKNAEDANALLGTLTDETPAAEAAEINAQFDAMMDERDACVAQADRLERSDVALADAEERRERLDREARDARRPHGAGEHGPASDGVSDEYRAAFRDYLASGADLSAIDSSARDALRTGAQEFRAQSGAAGAQGGFLVPETLAGFINVAAALHGPMMDESVATVINNGSGNPFALPKVDDTADTSTDAHTEGADAADDDSGDVVIGKDTLSAYTLITPWIKWSYELAQDSSFGWEQLLGNLIGERIGRKGNAWLTVGTGADQPQGFMTGAATGKTSTSQTALTFDDIIDLEHSVNAAYRHGPKVRFQMHDDTVKLLRKIKDNNGRYVWSDGDVTKGVPATLNGKPVSFNYAMDVPAAGKSPIAFGDFSQYFVRRTGSPLIGVAREKFFPNLGIAGVDRIDGAVGHSAALKKLTMAA